LNQKKVYTKNVSVLLCRSRVEEAKDERRGARRLPVSQGDGDPEVFDAMMRWTESAEDRLGFIFDVMDKSCFGGAERMQQALFAGFWTDDSEEEFECACQNISTVLQEGFPRFYYNSAFVVSCMKSWGICHDEEKATFAKNFPRFMRYDLTH